MTIPQTRGKTGQERAAYALRKKRKANEEIPDATGISRQVRRQLERRRTKVGFGKTREEMKGRRR